MDEFVHALFVMRSCLYTSESELWKIDYICEEVDNCIRYVRVYIFFDYLFLPGKSYISMQRFLWISP